MSVTEILTVALVVALILFAKEFHRANRLMESNARLRRQLNEARAAATASTTWRVERFACPRTQDKGQR